MDVVLVMFVLQRRKINAIFELTGCFSAHFVGKYLATTSLFLRYMMDNLALTHCLAVVGTATVCPCEHTAL